MSTSAYEFNAQDADVILRAPLRLGSDEFKDFHVHKLILSIASIFFRDMFSLPQPPRDTSEDTKGLDIIGVSETANVLHNFLQLIYPVNPPVIEDLRLLDDLFQFADKYMVESVTVKLKKLLVLPSLLMNDPISVYAIAHHANLKEATDMAITHTFKIDLIGGISRTHLQLMTAEAYNSLLASHAARRAELISVLDRVKPPSVNSGWCACGSGFYTGLRRDITLALWESPFLDQQRLDSCSSNPVLLPKSMCGLVRPCRVSAQTISNHLAKILEEVGKLG